MTQGTYAQSRYVRVPRIPDPRKNLERKNGRKALIWKNQESNKYFI